MANVCYRVWIPIQKCVIFSPSHYYYTISYHTTELICLIWTVTALQFEWAWQNPRKSRHVRGMAINRRFARGKLLHDVAIITSITIIHH
jgi:hypothetical protein